MYIEDQFWHHYIGDTDDSLTLMEHLAAKQKAVISLGEIFSDFGLDKQNGDFRQPDVPLVYVNAEGWEVPIYYAIDLVADLAALLLECKVNGSVDLRELMDGVETAAPVIEITAAPEELALVNQILMDFAAAPMAYDISELVPEEDLMEMAAVCELLREELCCPI